MGFQRHSTNLTGKLLFLPLLMAALVPAMLIFFLLHTEWGKPLTILESIKRDGVLLVATRNTATTRYEGPNGPTGPEHDLVTAFARSLGVKPEFITFDKDSELLDAIEGGAVHLAAPGMTFDGIQRRISLGPVYQHINRQLVYRAGTAAPAGLDEIANDEIEIADGSHHGEFLQQLRENDELYASWKTSTDMDVEQLLYLLQEKAIKYTIANSNVVDFNRRFYPDLRVAFDIGLQQPLQWALPRRKDSSLLDMVTRYFQRIRRNGKLDTILQRYYEHVDLLTFADTHTFWKHVDSRLPRYEQLFRRIARATGYDWRLLAAIGYQESHWNPRAVSPTGVKGLMMLTNATAELVDITDRTDPEQSLVGSVRYLKLLNEQIPDEIEKPDRQWFILAGYNVGFGHIEDARILTKQQGGNPNVWYEVRERLPLLAQSKYHTSLKHGYARGREPVTYVDNIRNYYELLVWHTSFRRVAVNSSQETDCPPTEERCL
ncbi:MAG: membrane-bound lytic murein transglycosylase MltF [Gammaproteobacteria bacterium]|jgi:membrane-bound lytic murein transglycosylase F